MRLLCPDIFYILRKRIQLFIESWKLFQHAYKFSQRNRFFFFIYMIFQYYFSTNQNVMAGEKRSSWNSTWLIFSNWSAAIYAISPASRTSKSIRSWWMHDRTIKNKKGNRASSQLYIRSRFANFPPALFPISLFQIPNIPCLLLSAMSYDLAPLAAPPKPPESPYRRTCTCFQPDYRWE